MANKQITKTERGHQLHDLLNEREQYYHQLLLEDNSLWLSSFGSLKKNSDHVEINVTTTDKERRDFFVIGYDNVLSVFVAEGAEVNKDYTCQQRHIKIDATLSKNFLLPANSNPRQAKANYKNGCVTIYIPTTNKLHAEKKLYRVVIF